MVVFRIGILLVILVVCVLRKGDALKCMQCKKASEPGDCSTPVECPVGESCYTEFYISPEGFLFYDMGCQPERICAAVADRKKRSAEKRLFETLPLCQECCNDDYCNRQGCLNQATPLVNNTVCYKCDDVRNPWECGYVESCVHNNEICATTQIMDFDTFEVRYKLECMSRERCKTISGSQTDGHPVANHARREIVSRDMNKRDGINTCIYCCEDDFCNDRDCKKGLTSMAPQSHKTTKIPTTSTVQPKTTPLRTTIISTTHRILSSTVKIWTTYSTKQTAQTLSSKPMTQKPKTSKPITSKPTSITLKPTTKPMPKPTSKPTTPKSTTSKQTIQKLTTPNLLITKPTQQKPSTTKPMTSKPTMPKLSTTPKPTTPKPSTTKPTTPKPSTTKPTTAKPSTTKATAKPLTTKATAKPTTPKPSTTKLTTAKPSTTKATTAKPSTTKPTAKLTTEKPSTTKPMTAKPTTLQPTSKSTTQKPTTSKSTPKTTILRTKPTTSSSNILSTWISASTNKIPQTTYKSTLWISAQTNSLLSNWVTVEKDTKPLTWVSAKTEPAMATSYVIGK